jgi:hypothetical protein
MDIIRDVGLPESQKFSHRQLHHIFVREISGGEGGVGCSQPKMHGMAALTGHSFALSGASPPTTALSSDQGQPREWQPGAACWGWARRRVRPLRRQLRASISMISSRQQPAAGSAQNTAAAAVAEAAEAAAEVAASWAVAGPGCRRGRGRHAGTRGGSAGPAAGA